MVDKEALKKIRFYDRIFWTGLTSLIISLTILLNEIEILDWGWIIGANVFIVCLVIITWGMIYHEFKRKDWVWIVATIIGVGFLVSIIYYFAVMRRAFKRGEGSYNDIWEEETEEQ